MNRDLIPQIDLLIERLQSWYGAQVEIVEQITRSPGNLDRHFTTRSSFVMRLELVMIAMSGCTLMLSGMIGDYQVDYQTTVDCLESLSIGTDEVLFVEKIGNVAERHSTFKRLTS